MTDGFALARRAVVRLAGTLPFAGLGLAAVARRAAAAAPAAGQPFANGINPASYVGGDGSYARYAKDGIRLGLIEAFPVNYTDPSGKRTGWNTDLVVAALERS